MVEYVLNAINCEFDIIPIEDTELPRVGDTIHLRTFEKIPDDDKKIKHSEWEVVKVKKVISLYRSKGNINYTGKYFHSITNVVNIKPVD